MGRGNSRPRLDALHAAGKPHLIVATWGQCWLQEVWGWFPQSCEGKGGGVLEEPTLCRK